MIANTSSETLPNNSNSQTWFESGHRDIERLIERLTTPYVDQGNMALHADELREECWWKVGSLMSRGALERCKTRQQFFGFVKVSLRNHIRSHLEKHLFTSKRTGIEPAALADVNRGVARKTVHVRVDDPSTAFDLPSNDSDLEMAILLRDFQRMLTPAETETLFELINSSSSEEAQVDRKTTERLLRRFQRFLQG